MATFVDTSALYALLSRTDDEHERASRTFERMLDLEERLVTHNYVLLETTALAQRRLGLEAVGALRDDLVPVLTVEWVDRTLHDQALAAAIASSNPRVSLVDRVSFEIMRRFGVRAAFAFDEDFQAEGFTAPEYP